MAGRTEFALLAPACTMMMTSLLSRLRRRGEQVLLAILMVVFVAGQSVPSFLMPAFNYRELSELKTLVDVDGVCIQSTGYTCGPAAAVTALRRVGVKAQEGDLAVLAHTTHMTGTPTDVLCDVITARHGVSCRQVHFRAIEGLRDCVPVIAVVKYAFLIDHFVTVLEVTDATAVVGDPLEGRVELTRDQFAHRWRKCGIVFDRSIREMPKEPSPGDGQ
jgi:predicted double-glycine peptidase